MAENNKLQSDVKNVKHRLEEKIHFEKKKNRQKGSIIAAETT